MVFACLGNRSSSQDEGKKQQNEQPLTSSIVKNDETLAPSNVRTEEISTSWYITNDEGYDPFYVVDDFDLGKLHRAIWHGKLNKVKKWAAKRDIDGVDKCNRTPMHLACCQGDFEIVKELLSLNAETYVGDNELKTPFIKAVECGHADIVKLLLNNDVSVEGRLDEGNTPLHFAVQHRYVVIINVLLKNGASTNLKNMQGQTPLHYAVLKQDYNIATILLKNNADVNAIDYNRRTPLMVAAYFGLLNIMNLLLTNGANIALQDDKGMRAIDHVVEQRPGPWSKECYLILDEMEIIQIRDEENLPMSTNGERQKDKDASKKPTELASGKTRPAESNVVHASDAKSDDDSAAPSPQPTSRNENKKEAEKRKEAIEIKNLENLLKAEVEKNGILQHELDMQKRTASNLNECISSLEQKIMDLEIKLKNTTTSVSPKKEQIEHENISLQDAKPGLEQETVHLKIRNNDLEKELRELQQVRNILDAKLKETHLQLQNKVLSVAQLDQLNKSLEMKIDYVYHETEKYRESKNAVEILLKAQIEKNRVLQNELDMQKRTTSKY